jgi:hypothetical protein
MTAHSCVEAPLATSFVITHVLLATSTVEKPAFGKLGMLETAVTWLARVFVSDK